MIFLFCSEIACWWFKSVPSKSSATNRYWTEAIVYCLYMQGYKISIIIKPFMDKNMDKNVFEALRKSEFGNRLEENIYLDHAGSTLFTDTQLTEAHQVLRANLLGNPHSQHPASVAIETDARAQVLKFFNTNSLEYEVIFTSGATSALKIVGQHFPWSQGSDFCYFVDNHTSGETKILFFFFKHCTLLLFQLSESVNLPLRKDLHFLWLIIISITCFNQNKRSPRWSAILMKKAFIFLLCRLKVIFLGLFTICPWWSEFKRNWIQVHRGVDVVFKSLKCICRVSNSWKMACSFGNRAFFVSFGLQYSRPGCRQIRWLPFPRSGCQLTWLCRFLLLQNVRISDGTGCPVDSQTSSALLFEESR